MKTDRLYGEMLYLLRQKTASASEMAERFEVSVRTVQRDMDTLALAGVPVYALAGRSGGYRIAENFAVERHPATRSDLAHIRTALMGLISATDDPEIRTTLEKLMAGGGSPSDGMILDFSVLREGNVMPLLRSLQEAIVGHKRVSFSYTNAAGATHPVEAEPVAVLYRWYSWYLLALPQTDAANPRPEDYRLYKLVRMQELAAGAPFARAHLPAEELLRQKDAGPGEQTTLLTLHCSQKASGAVCEYLRGNKTGETEDGRVIIECRAAETERFWLGTLLGLGDEAEVVSPPHIRVMLMKAAEKALRLYKEEKE